MKKSCESAVKRGKQLYMFEAALEYFISLLVSGSFFAVLTKELGLSDSFIGVLSSVISLGCLFQLFSIAIRRTKMKRFVILFSILNQLLFMLLYIVPLTHFSRQTKIAIFTIAIFSAYIIYNIVHPKKINWLMSLVEDNQRGVFTANKEILSLASGMIFSFLIGVIIDHFAENGKVKTAFCIAALVIFVIMALHSLSMIFTIEKESPQNVESDFKAALRQLVTNRDLVCVIGVFVLYYISTYISTPFYGTYQIIELGLNLKFVTAVITTGSISRMLVSKFWGRYADKHSFAVMLEKCFVFLGIAQVCMVIATPSNGKVMLILYYLFQGIAYGGISSALTNMTFDYVPHQSRADSLAIALALAGTVGFLTTLCISPLVTHIQNNHNTILGLSMYAQQFVTLLALLSTIGAIILLRCAFKKNKNGSNT